MGFFFLWGGGYFIVYGAPLRGSSCSGSWHPVVVIKDLSVNIR